MNTVLSNDMRELLIHDMRTPLATISAYARLLQRYAAGHDPDAQHFVSGLQYIEDAAVRFAVLLDELGELPQDAASANEEPQTERVDLVELAQRVSAESNPVGRRRVTVFPSISLLVGGWNRRALEHLVANLLENALKYSLEEQDVLVAVRREDNWAVLEVIDQGLGIPPAEQARVFDRGYRATNVSGRVCGTGLGLTGARHIVENHGGTITVQSELGTGTTVSVRLPIEREGP
jgi:signal transduction histidine kinase